MRRIDFEKKDLLSMNHDLGRFQVVVAGAGSAGCSAAIAAARSGARTLLIDRLPFAGGTSTGVLDTFYGFYTPGVQAKKIVGGLPDVIVSELRKLGKVVERANTYGAGTGITYNPEHLKVAWERLLVRSGVSLLLHSLIHDVDVKEGHITSLTLSNRAGTFQVRGDVFIDCTGDASLTHLSGFSYERAGELSAAQTLTTTFRMVNVDLAARKLVSKDQLHALMREASEDGFILPRKEGSDHITTVDNTTATVMTRLDSIRPTDDGFISVIEDPYFLTESELRGREQALEYARFLKAKIPEIGRAHV